MTATHVELRRVLLPFAALLLLIPWAVSSYSEAAAPTPEVLRAVHTDALHTTYDGSALKLNTRIGNSGAYREADSAGLIFNLEDKGSAKVELPDAPAFAFLGAPGEFVWIAPESQDPELIWPGWDTETLAAGAFRDDVVELTLLESQGPGNVEVFFNYDEFTGAVPRLFSSVDPGIRTLRQPVGRHVHANWAFTKLGTYTLTFEAAATTAAGVRVSSGPVAYTFVVGPYVPPATPPTSPPTTPPATPPTTTPTPTPPITPPTSPPTTSPTTSPTSPPTTPPSTPPGTPPPACVGAVLGVGHVDVAARTVNGRLRFQVKDGTGGAVVWRDPGTVAFHVRPSADERVPDSAAYRFLGAPGATVWQIPQTQAEDLLWAGWNTESVDYAALSGPVKWSLDKVQGPGKVAVYQFDQFGGPLVSFDSGKALPQSITLAEPTHAHGNWAFTKQGIYKLTFTYSATTKTGQRLSDTATLPVAVGATDLAALCPGGPPPSTPPHTTPPATQPTGTPSNPGQPGGPGPGQPRDPRTVPTPAGDAPTTQPVGTTPTLRPCVVTSTPSATSPTAATSSAPSASATTSPPASTTLSSGHADYAVRMEGGLLASRIKDATLAGSLVWRDPSRVVVRLTDAARTTAPGGAFGFLGAAGSPLWQIPQTQKDGVVWLGWNTEELSSAQVSGGVDWKLEKVDGPGRLAIFEFDSFGQPKVLFDSGNGLPDTYRIPLGTHAHGNWSFTQPGTYKVRFTHTATLTTGRQSADTATLTFEVGTAAPGGGAPAAEPLLSATNPVSASAAAPVAGGCRLASTGGSVGVGWIAGGAVLVVLGTVLLVAVRRRGATPPAAAQSSGQESGGAA